MFTTTTAQNFRQVTARQNGHIEINIDTAISLATELGTSQAGTAPRTGMSSLKHANKPLVVPLPFTLQKLSKIFHNSVSAMIAVLYSSRPRAFRFARSVSSRLFLLHAIKSPDSDNLQPQPISIGHHNLYQERRRMDNKQSIQTHTGIRTGRSCL